MIIRLEERIIAIQGHIKDIKDTVGGIQGCINGNETVILETRTILNSHLEQGKHSWKITAVIVSIISLVVSVIFKLFAG